MPDYAFTAHARDRCKERYGLDLSPADLVAIVSDCLEGRALVHHTGTSRSIYSLVRAGQRLVALVDPGRALLITFFPAEAITAGAKLRHHRRLGKVKGHFSTPNGLSQREYRREKIRVRDVEIDE